MTMPTEQAPGINIDVNDVVTDTTDKTGDTTDASSPSEIDEPAVDETDNLDGDPILDDNPEEEDPLAVEEPQDPNAPTFKSAEDRKAELNADIRGLVSQRNALRNEIERANAQVYAPQTADELQQLGLDPIDAKIEALEQRTKMAEYNSHVAEVTATINTEALQVMSDFPVFDSQSPEYDKQFADSVRAVYEKSAQIQTDPRTGMIIDVNVYPYEIYKAFAEARQAGSQKGVVQGQKATEKMLAAAETTSSSAPKAPKVDKFLEGLMSGIKSS